MIDMKNAHASARFTTRFNGKSYRENLSTAMRMLWAEFKKGKTSIDSALEELSEGTLIGLVYNLFRHGRGYTAELSDEWSRSWFESHKREALEFAGYGRDLP